MSVEWRWSRPLVGYSAHVGSWSAWIQLEHREVKPEGDDGPTFRVAVAGAKDADAFTVAIVGPGQDHAERYRLRGSLEQVRGKLAAALARRVAAPVPERPPPPAKWNGPGCWCHLHAAEAGAD